MLLTAITIMAVIATSDQTHTVMSQIMHSLVEDQTLHYPNLSLYLCDLIGFYVAGWLTEE